MTRTSLDRPITLPTAERERFAQDGHVLLRGVLARQDLLELEPPITAAVSRLDRHAGIPWGERTTYQRAFAQVTNLWREDENARRLVFASRLASLAAQLLDVDRVRLYHDQALYKSPSAGDGGHTPWHVDQYYWPLASDRSVTAWIPLVDVPMEAGPLAFASGSHRVEAGRALAISDESEAVCDDALVAAGCRTSEEPFALGDVSFHLGWCYHRAGINRTTQVRKVMTVIYIDAEMRVAEPEHDAQRHDLDVWFPGLQPGDLAASPINPVIPTEC